jgi:hypothetical protein
LEELYAGSLKTIVVEDKNGAQKQILITVKKGWLSVNI